MTNANMQFAVVEVDADAPENANVNPELEVTPLIWRYHHRSVLCMTAPPVSCHLRLSPLKARVRQAQVHCIYPKALPAILTYSVLFVCRTGSS